MPTGVTSNSSPWLSMRRAAEMSWMSSNLAWYCSCKMCSPLLPRVSAMLAGIATMLECNHALLHGVKMYAMAGRTATKTTLRTASVWTASAVATFNVLDSSLQYRHVTIHLVELRMYGGHVCTIARVRARCSGHGATSSVRRSELPHGLIEAGAGGLNRDVHGVNARLELHDVALDHSHMLVCDLSDRGLIHLACIVIRLDDVAQFVIGLDLAIAVSLEAVDQVQASVLDLLDFARPVIVVGLHRLDVDLVAQRHSQFLFERSEGVAPAGLARGGLLPDTRDVEQLGVDALVHVQELLVHVRRQLFDHHTCIVRHERVSLPLANCSHWRRQVRHRRWRWLGSKSNQGLRRDVRS